MDGEIYDGIWNISNSVIQFLVDSGLLYVDISVDDYRDYLVLISCYDKIIMFIIIVVLKSISMLYNSFLKG